MAGHVVARNALIILEVKLIHFNDHISFDQDSGYHGCNVLNRLQLTIQKTCAAVESRRQQTAISLETSTTVPDNLTSRMKLCRNGDVRLTRQNGVGAPINEYEMKVFSATTTIREIPFYASVLIR